MKNSKPSAVNQAGVTHSSASRSNRETTADENFTMTQCSAYSTVNSSQLPLYIYIYIYVLWARGSVAHM